jgi:hypothetical protein
LAGQHPARCPLETPWSRTVRSVREKRVRDSCRWWRHARLNRISSSGCSRPDWFKLDQRVRWVRRERYCTEVNCNPNCNPNCSAVAIM